MPQLINASKTLFFCVVGGAFACGLALACLGVVLIRFGSNGATEFSFFGQSFKSGNVGIAAIFIGGATIVLLIRRTLKSLDHVVRSESEPSNYPPNDDDDDQPGAPF
jgi:hypothetical protein